VVKTSHEKFSFDIERHVEDTYTLYAKMVSGANRWFGRKSFRRITRKQLEFKIIALLEHGKDGLAMEIPSIKKGGKNDRKRKES